MQVAFTEEQRGLLDNFKGTMGSTDADVVRNIVLAWLAEKSIITATVKKKIERGK